MLNFFLNFVTYLILKIINILEYESVSLDIKFIRKELTEITFDSFL